MHGADTILAEMEDSYRAADRLYRLEPGMPMTGLESIAVTRPIARVGRRRRRELEAALGLKDRCRIVLFAFAGMVPEAPPPVLADPGDLVLLGPDAWTGDGVRSADGTGLPFIDLLASVDLVVSKPGYGIVTELAANGTPAILVSRGDWPEEPFLVSWLGQRVPCHLVPRPEAVDRPLLDRVLAAPATRRRRTATGGEAQIAADIAAVLSRRERLYLRN